MDYGWLLKTRSYNIVNIFKRMSFCKATGSRSYVTVTKKLASIVGMWCGVKWHGIGFQCACK
jgi:hypothetical protein